MEWNYKKVIITVNSDNGKFCFSIRNVNYVEKSLELAKSKIDEILKDYYTFSKKDVDKLCKKLDKREAEFVKALIEELKNRRESALWEYGRLDNVLFEVE